MKSSICEEKQKYLNNEDWNNFLINAFKWKGLDKFGTVAEAVEWSDGPIGKYWHRNCKSILCGERKLQQAINRKNKLCIGVPVSVDEKKSFFDDDERPATRKKGRPNK